METDSQIHEIEQDQHIEEDFNCFPSKTYCVKTGCGKLYITICKNDGQILKVISNRKSAFRCDLTFFDALNRQTSFMTNRELEQAIDDLRGGEMHKCKNFNISVKSAWKRGELGAYSCADAVARCLERELNEVSE